MATAQQRLAFLKAHSWLYDERMVRLFCDDHEALPNAPLARHPPPLQAQPESWWRALAQLTAEQRSMAFNRRIPPTQCTELLDFFENCRRLSPLLSHAQASDKWSSEPDLSKASHTGDDFAADRDIQQQLSRVRGMNAKKLHEVRHLSKEILRLCNAVHTNVVVDVGSGSGYVGAALSLQNHYTTTLKHSHTASSFSEALHIVGIEASASVCRSAEQRMTALTAAAADTTSQSASSETLRHEQDTSSASVSVTEAQHTCLLPPPTVHACVLPGHDRYNRRVVRAALAHLHRRYKTLHSQEHRKDDRSKPVASMLSQPPTTERAVLVGLHACGDLTPALLQLAVSSHNVHGVALVSCCYQAMAERHLGRPIWSIYSDADTSQCSFPVFADVVFQGEGELLARAEDGEGSEQPTAATEHESSWNPASAVEDPQSHHPWRRLHNWPMSDLYAKAADEISCDPIGPHGLRRATQQEYALSQTEYEQRVSATIFRAAVENVLNSDQHLQLTGVRKRVAKKRFMTSFEAYLEGKFSNASLTEPRHHADCPQQSSFDGKDISQRFPWLKDRRLEPLMLQMMEEFLRQNRRRPEVESFLILQSWISPVIEETLLEDRAQFLREHGFSNVQLVPTFDPSLSPRCITIWARR